MGRETADIVAKGQPSTRGKQSVLVMRADLHLHIQCGHKPNGAAAQWSCRPCSRLHAPRLAKPNSYEVRVLRLTTSAGPLGCWTGAGCLLCSDHS